ncbi:MAG: hypothetical protein GXO62_07160 [Epsilonproteobacteria bacterium]|nr:hypothetical protein [Campylobacterota bacterium]
MRLSQLLLILTLLLFSRLEFEFLRYIGFLEQKSFKARVFTQYKKKNYYVLKLKNGDFAFYTTSRDNLKNLLNEVIEFRFVYKPSFFGYMGVFYSPAFDLRLVPVGALDYYISSQHRKLGNLFRALFLGESMEYELRKKLSALGVSHLFALSGLHLGMISFVLYWLIYPFYMLFQKRHPYRNRYVDIGVVVLLAEFVYLHICSYPPSLIRAYVLESVMFVAALRFWDIKDFRVLGLGVLVSVFLFLQKVFSLGFLLSVAGVYYIYLFFRYFKAGFFNSLLLMVYMFLVMFVWSHTFFGEFNNYQLLSPIANLVFGIFYPLEAFLHLIGYGGALDGFINAYLELGSKYRIVKFEWWVLGGFILLSLLAVNKKWAFYGINIIGFVLVMTSIRI